MIRRVLITTRCPAPIVPPFHCSNRGSYIYHCSHHTTHRHPPTSGGAGMREWSRISVDIYILFLPFHFLLLLLLPLLLLLLCFVSSFAVYFFLIFIHLCSIFFCFPFLCFVLFLYFYFPYTTFEIFLLLSSVRPSSLLYTLPSLTCSFVLECVVCSSYATSISLSTPTSHFPYFLCLV